VAKPEWGTKRVCLSCGARFYDMRRDPIVCPACGAPHDPMAQARPRRTRAPAAKAAAAVPAAEAAEIEPVEAEEEVVAEEVADDEDEVVVGKDTDSNNEEDEEEGDTAIEDVSELGDDDMTDVIDTEIDEEEGER